MIIFFQFIDDMLISVFSLKTVKLEFFRDIIIAEVGVSGVILGLYCSNISSVYSTSYSNAPKEIAKAFQCDELTAKCMNSIISFIVYGSFVLIKLMLGYNVGWVTSCVLILWSLVVVISYRVVGNRIYQLSDVFNVSDDAFIMLYRIVVKQLNKNIYSTDIDYQNYFCKCAESNINLLKTIQKYGCQLNLDNNASIVNFMHKNLYLLVQYWEKKQSIPRESLWFRRKGKYQKWHLANDSEVSLALRTGTALKPKKEPDYYWFEDEIMSLNRTCINYLVKKVDYESLYSYIDIFESMCELSIVHKETDYYVGQIDWIKNLIQKIIKEEKIRDSIAFTGIIEQISLLYLNIILEAGKYFQNFNFNDFYKSIIDAIDSGKLIDEIKEICGSNNIDLYKKILMEIYIEGHRITPDWLIKQYVAKEEVIYMNSLADMVREGINHAYSLGKTLLKEKMYFEACIIFIRFYEYESKLTNFYKFGEQKYEEMIKYHLDIGDKWEDNKFGKVKEIFLQYKKELPNLLLECTTEFAMKNWNCREDYPDFLGECYNHISEDSIEAITSNNKEQYERDFENLTKLMLLYQEYIRSDFIKNKDLYRIEYAYYMFTSPIVEWAQIGGLAILWGEFINDKDWGNIVKKAFKIILNSKGDENSTELAEKLIEYVQQRNKFMMGIGSRDILKSKWNLCVENAIKEEVNIESEYLMFETRIKTENNLLNAFCPNFLNYGFSIDPSEVFWVVCVNPLLSTEKQFHTRFSWEEKLHG